MKTKEEIQAAHDMIVPLLSGEVPNPLNPKDTERFHIAADVLCWVLDHEHNKAFARNLDQLCNLMKAHGFELTDYGN